MKARMSRSRKFLTSKVGFDLSRKVFIIPEQSRDYLFIYASSLFSSLGMAGGNMFYFPFIKDKLKSWYGE